MGGNDVILGGESRDKLFGGTGNDTLIGGNGNDILSGGSGNNILEGVGEDFGSSDFDTLRGNNGINTFILGDDSNIFYRDSGYATIIGFESSRDTVHLLGSSANTYSLTIVAGDTELFLNDKDD